MKFFNKKEEVLDIELTQYGKSLLSRGVFKPVYYAFYDNNILYDTQFGSTTHNQHKTDERIFNETPALRSQHNYGNLDTKRAHEAFQNNTERHFTFVNPIGSSDLVSKSAPKWSLLALQGEFSSSIAYMTSSFQTIKIPQIEVNIEYQTAVSVQGQPTVFEEDPELASSTFPDGSRISVKPEQLLLRVLEENVDFEKDNFDIEVYLMEQENDDRIGGNTIEVMTPLYFKEKPPQVQDDILVDPEIIQSPTTLSANNVEYYFDVFTDHEVDSNLLCQSIEALKKQDIYLDMDIECPDVKTPFMSAPPYEAQTTSEAIDEVCKD